MKQLSLFSALLDRWSPGVRWFCGVAGEDGHKDRIDDWVLGSLFGVVPALLLGSIGIRSPGIAVLVAVLFLVTKWLFSVSRFWGHARLSVLLSSWTLPLALFARAQWPHDLVHAGRCDLDDRVLGPGIAIPYLYLILPLSIGVALLDKLPVRDLSGLGLASSARVLLSRIVLLVALGAVGLVALGIRSWGWAAGPALLSGYLAGLPEIGRLPGPPARPPEPQDLLPAPDDGPWRWDRGAWVAGLGELVVHRNQRGLVGFSRGEEVPDLVVGSRSMPSWSRGGLSFRRDNARGYLFVEFGLAPGEQVKGIRTSHDQTGRVAAFDLRSLRQVSLSPLDLFGPQPVPASWVLLSVGGLLVAGLTLGRDRRLLQALSSPGRCIACEVDEHGAIELPGGTLAPPPGLLRSAGPVVVVLEGNPAVDPYRGPGAPAVLAFLPGTIEQVERAASGARVAALFVALVTMVLSSTPLATAIWALLSP